MERKELVSGSVVYSFLTAGRGPNILLCLHGFGEEARSFSFLEQEAGDAFTLIAPDLPWHGETKWNGSLEFPLSKFLALVEALVPPAKHPRFHLLCYSMGGRAGLCLLQHIPHRIASAVLLAPDGLRMNPWYWLATQTQPGNRLFRYTMQQPHWFIRIVNTFRRLQLINASIAKYVHHYLDNPTARIDLYHIWTTLRQLQPRLQTVKQQLHQFELTVHLVFGTYDRIIPPQNGQRLQQGAEPWVRLHELQAGHQLLKPKHAAFIISLLTAE